MHTRLTALITTRSELSIPARSSATTRSTGSQNLSRQRQTPPPPCQREGISVVPTTNGLKPSAHYLLPTVQCPDTAQYQLPSPWLQLPTTEQTLPIFHCRR
nr:hypothetical protein BgiMline_010247 [Biomphalaria glabrata]